MDRLLLLTVGHAATVTLGALVAAWMTGTMVLLLLTRESVSDRFTLRCRYAAETAGTAVVAQYIAFFTLTWLLDFVGIYLSFVVATVLAARLVRRRHMRKLAGPWIASMAVVAFSYATFGATMYLLRSFVNIDH